MEDLIRVKIMKDFDNGHGNTIPAGTVGTKRETLNNLELIQYGFKENAPLLIGIPPVMLEEAKKEDIINVNPSNLIPKIYHPGNRYLVGKDNEAKIGTITEIKLALNEKNDEFILRFEDGIEKEYVRDYLDHYASLVPTEEILEMDNLDEAVTSIETNVESNIESKQCNCNCKEVNGSLIDGQGLLIDIDGFEFIISTDGNITIPGVKIKEINNLKQSLDKLNYWINTIKGGE